MDLSVVVNFYNMGREAARSLHALSRAYQQDIENLTYEVLCLDNGSSPPLDQAWVEAFGPEFRLLRPSRILPSPCFAINEAARAARGRYLAVMIDGAHVPTPGMFREAMAAVREDADAVVGLRQWWVGGEQRWLAQGGYTPQMEDALFESIAWPSNGYGLFRIGAPISEADFPWTDGLTETNCLFLPASLYAQIGGFDEAFDVAGGGFANLDLMRRAAGAARGSVVALVGEATFHQFHGGSTTNVCDAEKDRRVRAYASRYVQLRGERFEPVPRHRLRLRGRIPPEMPVTRRAAYPAPIALGADVRPLPVNSVFRPADRRAMAAAFVEAGLHLNTSWLGHPVSLAPGDLTAIQEIITRTRPQRTVLVRPEPGLLAFVDSIHRLTGQKKAQIVVVTDQPDLGVEVHTPVRIIEGDPYSPEAARKALAAVGSVEATLVLFRPPEDDPCPTAPLRSYAGLVSHRGYLVYLGTVLGQPWLGYSTSRHRSAINGLLRRAPDFVVDERCEGGVISLCASGFLLKAGRRAEDDERGYDASLDQLEAFEPA